MAISVKKHEEMSALIGKTVKVVELTNRTQMVVRVLTLGGILLGIDMPDRDGVLENILMSYEDFHNWKDNPFYLNAVIGPSAGRMEGARLELDGKVFELDDNNYGNCLHGGAAGFHRQLWEIDETFEDDSKVQVALKYKHPDGLGGFPGDIEVKVVYTLRANRQLDIEFFAHADKVAHLNMTHHNYYNLSGNCKRNIDKQELWINSRQYYPLNENSIPICVADAVEDSPFDFTALKPIELSYITPFKGLDHPYDLRRPVMSDGPCVVMFDRESGRKMEVFTASDSLVVYTQNVSSQHHMGICFETQCKPNTVCRIDAAKTYHQKSSLVFSVFKAT